MHQKINQYNLLSYWIIKAYDPSIDKFVEVYKTYGHNIANEKLAEYLKNGVCAVIREEKLPPII